MTANSVKSGDAPADRSEVVDKEVEMFQAMADSQKKVMPMIGKEGKTAEDIQKEICQAMTKAIFETRPAPEIAGGHRAVNIAT